MTPQEWESLCDGCGICCLEKVENVDTGAIELMPLSCEFLDIVDCRCMIYEDRFLVNPHCIKLSPGNIEKITWLPETCAYRSVAEGRELGWWHPLVSGNFHTVHEAGISVRDKVLSGRYIHPQDFQKSAVSRREH